MQLVQETKNLVRLTRFGMVNCFLAREDDGFTLIDTGVAGSAPGIREAAQSLGAPIRRILLTHAHIDHVGSLDALVREYPGMEFALGQRESRLLRKDFSLDAGETGKTLVGFPGAKSQPTRLLNDRDRIGSLQAVVSPGHTPAILLFWTCGMALSLPEMLLPRRLECWPQEHSNFSFRFLLCFRGTVKSRQKARGNCAV